MAAACLAGGHLTLATPDGSQPEPVLITEARDIAETNGGNLRVTREPSERIATPRVALTRKILGETSVQKAAKLTSDETDSGALEEIDAGECWKLLSTQRIGRLAVMVGHYPLIFPVSFALDDNVIVFRTAPGTKLYAIEHSNVTFAVDEIDVAHRSGWSVLVRGVAHQLLARRSVELAARFEASGVQPWAPGERDRIVRIVADQITGRRIRPGELVNPVDPDTET